MARTELYELPRCPKILKTGKRCRYPAGLGTGHLGFGTCNRHGGAWPKSEELWSKAMEISKRENVTPTEALLSLVQIGMGRSAYIESVLVEKLKAHVEKGGDPLRPPAYLKEWLEESRQERKLAAQTAKSAVDAGVMVALAQQRDLDGSLVADAVTAALDALQLEPEERMKALGAAQQRLLDAE